MSLLVLMYHRARAGRHGNSPEMLDAHFGHIADRHRHVLPGEALQADALNVCLSFDDGYFDFYAVVFPLLQKHRLRALLAVPVQVVQDKVRAGREQRLAVESEAAFTEPRLGGFCTWGELREMAASGHVTIAAHGYSHCRLDLATKNLARELDESQTKLQARLAQPVDSFAFPFGRYDSQSLTHARRSYRHVLRIGGASNRAWGQRLLYRVDADGMQSPTELFSSSRRAMYHARYLWNRLRRR